MNTATLAAHCKELLLTHNRVSLGTMGAFVAQDIPATFTHNSRVLQPPTRRISFKSSEVWDDGLLRAACGEEGEELDELIKELQAKLKKEKSVELEGFGKLRATQQGQLFFVMEKDLTLHPEGFGLVPLSLSPLDTPSKIKCARPKPPVEAPAETPAEKPVEKPVVPPTPSSAPVETPVETPSETPSETPAETPAATPAAAAVAQKKSRGWLWIVLALVILIVLAFAVYYFREPLQPYLERLLYSTEERQLL